MNRSRIRIQIAVLAFILLPASVGILAVHASATCERFVRTYVTTPVRNQVSKQTAQAWAAWRTAHPNWKPNPNIHRPRYVMTREEAVEKVNFACSIPTDPVNLDLVFTPTSFAAPPVITDLPNMEIAQTLLPSELPPQVVQVVQVMPVLPIVPPQFSLQTGAIPEPGSWLLVATGLGFLCLVMGAKALRPEA
jgi:hypothetical protein